MNEAQISVFLPWLAHLYAYIRAKKTMQSDFNFHALISKKVLETSKKMSGQKSPLLRQK
jgi:hypothetical protein